MEATVFLTRAGRVSAPRVVRRTPRWLGVPVPRRRGRLDGCHGITRTSRRRHGLPRTRPPDPVVTARRRIDPHRWKGRAKWRFGYNGSFGSTGSAILRGIIATLRRPAATVIGPDLGLGRPGALPNCDAALLVANRLVA